MAAASPSSLLFSGHLSFRPFSNPNHPRTGILRPRNPSRWISCSPHKLGSIQRYPVSLGWRSPFMLQNVRKSKALGAMGYLPEIQRTQIEKEEFHDLPAMVSCATMADEYGTKDVTLVLSNFGSDGALLKQFSIQCVGYRPFMMSACRDLVHVQYHEAFLCNVATEEMITLPHINDRHGYMGVKGFGYVPSTKEFKLLSNLSPYGLGFKVLTLGADQWRDVEDPPLDVHVCQNAVFVNGAIHFQTSDNRIATFHLETEEWGSIAGPPIPSNLLLSMKELSGYLCIIDMTTCKTSIDIWLLKDYCNHSWVKECTINLSDLFCNDSIIVEVDVNPLAIEDDGKILIQVKRFTLQLYDPKTKSCREIYRFKHSNGIYVQVLSSMGNSIQLGL